MEQVDMDSLHHFVFEVNLTDRNFNRLDERVQFSCSNVRWYTLKKEIEQGEFLIDIGTIKTILVTNDRNKSKSVATEF